MFHLRKERPAKVFCYMLNGKKILIPKTNRDYEQLQSFYRNQSTQFLLLSDVENKVPDEYNHQFVLK